MKINVPYFILAHLIVFAQAVAWVVSWAGTSIGAVKDRGDDTVLLFFSSFLPIIIYYRFAHRLWTAKISISDPSRRQEAEEEQPTDE
jgi:hypothetical protein